MNQVHPHFHPFLKDENQFLCCTMKGMRQVCSCWNQMAFKRAASCHQGSVSSIRLANTYPELKIKRSCVAKQSFHYLSVCLIYCWSVCFVFYISSSVCLFIGPSVCFFKSLPGPGIEPGIFWFILINFLSFCCWVTLAPSVHQYYWLLALLCIYMLGLSLSLSFSLSLFISFSLCLSFSFSLPISLSLSLYSFVFSFICVCVHLSGCWDFQFKLGWNLRWTSSTGVTTLTWRWG